MTILSSERKFIAPTVQADVVLGLAAHHAVPDPQYPTGVIATVYYDTPRLQAYADKVEGDNLKKKVRLRWYDRASDADEHATQPVFLECKHRLGSARFKQRAVLNVEYARLDRAPLNDPFFVHVLRRGAEALDDSLPLEWIPSVCIRYTRRRFVCPRTFTRIAVDTDIRVDRVNHDVVPNALLPKLNVVVCEFKGDGFRDLPWADKLNACGFRLKSFSKYGVCINRLLNGGI